MERVQNVSVLFTDLVGSTALSSSVSPEEGDALRREHFAVLRRAVAEADGTEVKNLGDGLMVVFPTASAALSCAVGMQQATELDNRGRDRPFGLRVGVSGGEVSEEDGDYFGDPVVEAARLCARCDSGQVLAADLVRAMAGRRAGFEYVSLGDLDLKGLPEPVAAVEVRWEPVEPSVGAERVPLPARLAAAPPSGVVGRTTELGELTAAFKRVAAGGGREVVVVAGEAGTGKTTLVAEMAREAFEAGACVLFGHAEEGLSTPYGLFAEALGHLVTHGPEEELRAHVAECGVDLSRLVPALGRRLADLPSPSSGDSETERYRLFSAAVEVLGRVAAERPVVVVLDDLQWADTASLQLLRHLAGSDPTLRLLVVGTFRDTEINAGHALGDTLGALWRMDGVSRVDLRGLDDVGVVDLLAAVAGHDLDEAGVGLARAVYRETDGNPFFVTEVLRHLAESGAIYQDDSGRWVSDQTLDDLRLPDSVREVIGARVGRLGPQAGRVLSTAAVIGRDFDLELLARATEVDEDDVLDLLEAAERVALVRDPSSVVGRFSFAHALIQRTLYQDLSATRRARTHERVAEALEDLTAGRPGERVGELAHHWAQATRPADVAKAVEYAAQAGDAALAALAPADAIGWYAQAVDLLGDGDPHRRARLLVGLGGAQRADGRAEFRETLLAAARLADDTDDPVLLAEAALTNTRGFVSRIGVLDEERLAVVDRALERLGDDHPARRASLLSLSVMEREYHAPIEERLAQAREAVALARASGDPSALVTTAYQAALGANVAWNAAERLGWMTEAAQAAQAADAPGDRDRQYRVTVILRNCAIELGDRDLLDATTEEADRLIDHLPPVTRWAHAFHGAYLAFLDGDVERGEQLASEALALGTELHQADAADIFGVQFANLQEMKGRFGDLVPLVEETVRRLPALPSYRTVLINAYADAGQLERARAMLDADREAGFEMPATMSWLNAHMQWAKAAVTVGDHDTAEVMRERLAPVRDQVIFTGLTVCPVAGHYVGRLEHLLGRLDDAHASFARAHQVHQRLRAPQFQARTEIRWAQMLSDRNRPGDHDRARDLAQAARTAAEDRPGWEWIERDADAVLAQLA